MPRRGLGAGVIIAEQAIAGEQVVQARAKAGRGMLLITFGEQRQVRLPVFEEAADDSCTPLCNMKHQGSFS